MQSNVSHPLLKIMSVAIVSATVAAAASAAPITDPTLTTVIDPSGGQNVDVNAGGAVTGIADLSVIQNWDGWVQADAKAAGQVISFTSNTYADLNITVSSAHAAGTLADAPDGRGTSTSTSTDDAIELRNWSNAPIGATVTVTVDFGDYDTATQTFNGAVNGVKSAAFTISELTPVMSLSVTFYDGATALSTQTATGAVEPSTTSGGLDVYVGFTAGEGQSIDRIVITRTLTGADPNDVAPRSYFDDLGFTVIPEPASLTLTTLGAGLIFARRKPRD